MKNAKKFIIPGVILAAVGLLLYFGFFRKSAASTTPGTTLPGGSTPNTNTTSASETFPLKQGSRGDKVRELQQFLNRRILPPLVALDVDGIFGPKTEAALFQVTGRKQVTEAEFNLYKTQK